MGMAEIVIQQMGGAGRLKMFIGAKNFLKDERKNSVMFSFKKGGNKSNHITVKLNAMDTYDVTFKQLTRKKDKDLGIFLPHVNVISEHEGIYSDMLINLFEQETSLYLSF